MGKVNERYCLNGHDVTKVGRRKNNGGCNECIRVRQRLYMRAVRRGERFRSPSSRRMLPKAPLLKAIEKAAPRYITNQAGDKGYIGLSTAYASRFPDTTQAAADRMIHRLANKKTQRVEEETADRWCVVLGVHPIQLWPEEWPLEAEG